ncbi:MAG TPA: SRPBCC family protein [Caulobacteraceae bacterium]|nr:SRPBCC family protein [Caulobacteraceae bacterium]
MTIAPIVKTLTLEAPPERAFQAFTASMGAWWPRGQTVGAKPHQDVIMEPRVGGRWFERDAQGAETQWGKVLAWEPPGRVLLAWQLNSQWAYDPDFVTELELTFTPAGAGGTEVRLEHRNLERFGADAEKFAAQLGGGWPKFLAEYAAFADQTQKEEIRP